MHCDLNKLPNAIAAWRDLVTEIVTSEQHLTENGSWMAKATEMLAYSQASAEYTFSQMVFEDGRIGYYLDHPSLYFDIEPDKDGNWTFFFRDQKTGYEVYGPAVS